MQGRVKAARVTTAAAQGAEKILERDWVRAAYFFTRFRIAQEQFRYGSK